MTNIVEAFNILEYLIITQIILKNIYYINLDLLEKYSIIQFFGPKGSSFQSAKMFILHQLIKHCMLLTALN